jgi:hypothetical protein
VDTPEQQIRDLFTRQLRKLGDVEVVPVSDAFSRARGTSELPDVYLKVLVYETSRSLQESKVRGPRYALAVIATHPSEWDSAHPRLKSPMGLIDRLHFVAEHDDHHLAQMSELITAGNRLGRIGRGVALRHFYGGWKSPEFLSFCADLNKVASRTSGQAFQLGKLHDTLIGSIADANSLARSTERNIARTRMISAVEQKQGGLGLFGPSYFATHPGHGLCVAR